MSFLPEMARLLADQKLVPFFGAGISRPHLGFAAAELAAEMARLTDLPTDTPLAAAADAFVRHFGEKAFVEYLRSRLLVERFDDTKGSSYQYLLSLSCNALYTTNQDNLFERCAVLYGRLYRCIVTIKDFSDARPGESRLYKYHGDLSESSSIVFTSTQYRKRLDDTRNPFNIRLQSDLIGKSILFIGYSFQDENVRKLFEEIRIVLGGAIPTSYLISFDENQNLEDDCNAFGIRYVLPKRMFPAAQTDQEAFECCLQTLCNKTMQVKAERSLENLFSNGQTIDKVLVERELTALEQTIKNEDFSIGLKAFRASIDATDIPSHLQRRIAEVFISLAEKAASEKDLLDLRSALFNLHLDFVHALVAMAGYMAANRVRKVSKGWDGSHLIASQSMPEEMWPLAAAHAVDMLVKGGYIITDGFRQVATHWFESFFDSSFSWLSDKGQAFIRQQIEVAWSGSQMESPAALAERLGPLRRPVFRVKKFREIMADMERNLPQQFRSYKDLT